MEQSLIERILWIGESDRAIVELLRREVPERFELMLPEGDHPATQELGQAHYILNGSGSITAEMMRAAPNLKLVQRLGVGLDGVDLPAARELDVAVANLPALNATAVAEHTMLLTLACARHLCTLHAQLLGGRWAPNDQLHSTFELQGKTFGIIGFGNIGRTVARRAAAFGMEIRYFDTGAQPHEAGDGAAASYAPLEELVAIADVLSIHVPHPAGAEPLLGDGELAGMKPGSVLLNTSRSGAVDEAALIRHLRAGNIGAAGIDVWASEPIDPDAPLLHAPNVVATPHVGAQTVDTVVRTLRAAIANIVQAGGGAPVKTRSA